MRDTNIPDKEIVNLGEITSRRNSDIPINDIYSISLLKSNSLIELQGVKVGMQDADEAKSNLISARARSSLHDIFDIGINCSTEVYQIWAASWQPKQ